MLMNNTLELKEIQKAALDVLVELDSICRELHLNYSLTYGTLIGAIRHKGFIPWDDDIDIIMPRNDYNKLREWFKTGKKSHLKWCDRTTVKNYPYCISRVSNMDYKYTTTNANQKRFDIGVFVDVYVLDNYCSNSKDALRLGKKIWLINREFDLYLNPDKTSGTLKRIVRNVLSSILHVLHGNDWCKHVDIEIEDYIVRHTSSSDELVGVISQYEWKEIMKKEWFTSYIDVPFEDNLFKVCSGWDKLLNSIYGDYMLLPPVENRVPTHNYTLVKREN